MVKKLAIVFTENCQKRALCDDRPPLRRDTIASRDRFQPMGARHNLALYYNSRQIPFKSTISGRSAAFLRHKECSPMPGFFFVFC